MFRCLVLFSYLILLKSYVMIDRWSLLTTGQARVLAGNSKPELPDPRCRLWLQMASTVQNGSARILDILANPQCFGQPSLLHNLKELFLSMI